MTNSKNFEVIIIGGSYAGLSAAMVLGRSLRNVLIIDSGLPCNRQTPHSHNFLTQDGSTPKEIAKIAKSQVSKYNTVKFYEGLAISGSRIAKGFEITTSKGDIFTANKLIFATGIKDIMSEIKGFSDCWGISVVHCPYCHGYEFRNQKTGILANGERAFHLASLIYNLSKKLTVFTSGKPNFNTEQLAKLNKHNIQIIETQITEIEHKNGYMKRIILSDVSKLECDALYAALPFTQYSDIPESLGCELTEHGHLKINPFQSTNIQGIYACGDNSTIMRSIAHAIYSGNLAGAMINKELTDEQF